MTVSDPGVGQQQWDVSSCTCPLGPVVIRPWGHWRSCAAYKPRPTHGPEGAGQQQGREQMHGPWCNGYLMGACECNGRLVTSPTPPARDSGRLALACTECG